VKTGFLSFAALALITGASLQPAYADDLNQVQSMAAAAAVNRQASDSSLQGATTKAMQALMDLAAQNRTSAIKNGYSAYNSYLNSVNLDTDRMKNGFYAMRMSGSNGVGVSSSADYVPEDPSNFSNPFGRLDSSFLQKGDAASVAAKFEQQSGMSRKDFLAEMTRLSQSGISSTDPQMTEKLSSQFNAFLQKIPNADFRKKLDSAISSVPSFMRSKILADGLRQVSNALASAAPAKGEEERKPASADPQQPEKKAEAASDAFPGDGEKVATAPTKEAVPGFEGSIGVDPHSLELDKMGNDGVGSLLHWAEDQGDSIFTQVSNKYRKLSSMLELKPRK
jgi:hypothetical protein